MTFPPSLVAWAAGQLRASEPDPAHREVPAPPPRPVQVPQPVETPQWVAEEALVLARLAALTDLTSPLEAARALFTEETTHA